MELGHVEIGCYFGYDNMGITQPIPFTPRALNYDLPRGVISRKPLDQCLIYESIKHLCDNYP